MNDETLHTEEHAVPEAEATSTVETIFVETADGAVTEAVSYISLTDVQAIGSDIVHADLFGSFLVCGTLIGLFLLRGIYGT